MMNSIGQTGKRPKAVLTVVLAVIVSISLVLLFLSRQSTSIDWLPYSSTAIAENASHGRPTVVLYIARWTMSADSQGALATPNITRALSDSRFAAMSADVTDSSDERLQHLNKEGIDSLPVLVLYAVDGAKLEFDSEASEAEIVAAINRLGR